MEIEIIWHRIFMITIWSLGRSMYVQEYLVHPYIRWLKTVKSPEAIASPAAR